MRPSMLLLIPLTIVYSCKQQPKRLESDINKSDTIKSIEKIENNDQQSHLIKELSSFAETEIEENSQYQKLFLAKTIDTEENIATISLQQGLKLYKEITTSKTPKSMPLFEISGTNNVILLVMSKGYTDVIWAKILIDKTTLEIKKIEFDHKAESEGYGAEFTLNNFENRFSNTKISLTSNTFGLRQNNKLLIKGNQKIDGISGATVTSQSAVAMINTGLQRYQKYFLN